MNTTRKVIRHWWPDDKPEPWIRCIGAPEAGRVKVTGYLNGTVYEHITTRNRMAVNCEACHGHLPEVVALCKERAERAAKIIEALAQLGISASYEDTHRGTASFPMISLHVDEAEQLLLRIAGLQQVAAQLQGAADLLGFAGPAQPGDVIPS